MVLPVGLNIRSNNDRSASPSTSTSTLSAAAAVASTSANASRTDLEPTRVSYSTSNTRSTTSAVQIQTVPTPFVDFVILKDGKRCMVRCSRKAIMEHSVELTRMIQNPRYSSNYRRGVEQTQFQINDVDPQNFEMLTRFLETRFIRFQGVTHMIEIAMLAERFKCHNLYIHCIKEMDLFMSVDTVWEIYGAMSHFRNLLMGLQNADLEDKPEEPRERDRSRSRSRSRSGTRDKVQKIRLRAPRTMEEYGATLLYNALEFIDMHAEFLLSDSRINSLPYEEFAMVIRRDRLQVRSELTVYVCLADWSREECRRRDLSPSPENRRQMLGPLCYTPRYLRMTTDDFTRACYRIDLLDPTEEALVRMALKGEKLTDVRPEQLELLKRFACRRPDYADMPIYLSDRSDYRNYSRGMRSSDQEEESCYKSLGMNCLTIFTCVFD